VDTRDPATLARVTSGLAERGITVSATTYADDVAAAYGRSAAAWSLQLALAVGILSLLVAAAGIVVLASTSRRARSRDYAVLRLVGQRPRSLGLLAQLETLPVIVVSALLGAAVGLWAAPAAVGMVPLFTSPSPTFPVDLRTAWTPALLAGLVGLVVLTVVGIVTSRRIARRADLQRLRETV
jgi:ABC-type antimicrobial peptide transport system permease subunit